jgi:hypothetical protein
VGRDLLITIAGGPRAAAVVVAVRPDPVADAGFVGRGDELAELLGLLAPHDANAGAMTGAGPGAGAAGVVVSAVAGAPGVGKTALAQLSARSTQVLGLLGLLAGAGAQSRPSGPPIELGRRSIELDHYATTWWHQHFVDAG